MSKKIPEQSIIHFELQGLEDKVKEFQQYLKINPIIAQVTKDNIVLLGDEEQDKLHKELLLQIKVQYALFDWVPLLAKLRESEESKTMETRGDEETSGLFNKFKK